MPLMTQALWTQINESIRTSAAYISGTCWVSNSPITLPLLITPTLTPIQREQVDHGANGGKIGSPASSTKCFITSRSASVAMYCVESQSGARSPAHVLENYCGKNDTLIFNFVIGFMSAFGWSQWFYVDLSYSKEEGNYLLFIFLVEKTNDSHHWLYHSCRLVSCLRLFRIIGSCHQLVLHNIQFSQNVIFTITSE